MFPCGLERGINEGETCPAGLAINALLVRREEGVR